MLKSLDFERVKEDLLAEKKRVFPHLQFKWPNWKTNPSFQSRLNLSIPYFIENLFKMSSDDTLWPLCLSQIDYCCGTPQLYFDLQSLMIHYIFDRKEGLSITSRWYGKSSGMHLHSFQIKPETYGLQIQDKKEQMEIKQLLADSIHCMSLDVIGLIAEYTYQYCVSLNNILSWTKQTCEQAKQNIAALVPGTIFIPTGIMFCSDHASEKNVLFVLLDKKHYSYQQSQTKSSFVGKVVNVKDDAIEVVLGQR